MANVSIIASRFNNLRDRIVAIYGDPASASSTTGYAQGVLSRAVNDLTLVPKNITASNITSNRVTVTGHGLSNSDVVEYDPNGKTPLFELYDEHHYYVKVIDANTLELFYDEALTDQVDIVSTSTYPHILNFLDGDKVSASDYFNLYLDMAAARVHQKGPLYTIPNNVLLATGDLVEEAYLTDLEAFITDIETEKFLVGSNQITLENLKDGTGTDVNSTRTTAWNGTISHEFNVNFADAAARTGYFNAGGEIRFAGSLTGGSGTKTDDWRNMFTGVGTVTFARAGVSRTGTGAGTSLGTVTPYTLTTSYQLLLQKNGATYLANRYYIYAKLVGTTTIRFLVQYADLDTGGSGLPGGTFGPDPVDENVNGTIRSNVSIYRPNGSFTVNGVGYNSVTFAVTGLNISTL